MHNQKSYYQDCLNINAHTSVPWQQIILKEFLQQIILPNDTRVLDVGAGVGNNVASLKHFFKEAFFLDISPNALRVLKTRHVKEGINLRTVVASADRMPFQSDFFDLVICTEVLEHCENINRTIKECLRVLRPGGYIIISSPNYFNFAGIVKIWHEKFKKGVWDAWGNHSEGIENILTAFTLHSLMRKNNIKIISTRGGDCIRSWLPFFRKHYIFIDKHPCLKIGQIPFFQYFLMNCFILGRKSK